MNWTVAPACADDIPSGILVNIEESMGALDLVRSLRPKFLFTGHDPQACLEYGH
jgi:hypothetical protein